MNATTAALAQVRATMRAAWIACLGTVLAALISAGALLLDSGSGTSANAATAGGQAGQTELSAPMPCQLMVANTLALIRSHPKVAAAYGEAGAADLPALADADDMQRCGGHSPELLLEAHYDSP